MVNEFAITLGRRGELDGFESCLMEQRHNSLPPDHLLVGLQPNIRRVRVFKFITKKEDQDLLLDDLAPYNGTGAILKDHLAFIMKYFLPMAIKLKLVRKSKSKRQVENPVYRDHINVFVLGYNERNVGGVDIQHTYVLMEAQRKYSNGFLDWLEQRKYITQLPNVPGQEYYTEVRELRLLDLSTMSTCMPKLLFDLSPYDIIDNTQSWLNRQLIKLGRKLLGLKPPYGASWVTPGHVPEFRKYIEVYTLARKSDQQIRDPDWAPIADMI